MTLGVPTTLHSLASVEAGIARKFFAEDRQAREPTPRSMLPKARSAGYGASAIRTRTPNLVPSTGVAVDVSAVFNTAIDYILVLHP
jgi:hypothetical protein